MLLIYLQVVPDKFWGWTVVKMKWNMNVVVCAYVSFDYNHPRVFSGKYKSTFFQCTNSDDSTKVRFADGGETWWCPTISQERTCKHTQVKEYLSRLVVSLNLPSHFALIHQSTYLSGADNFAVIIIALTSFENDYTAWLAHSRSTRGICLKRLVKWSLFY